MTPNQLIELVQNGIKNADARQSKLTPEILKVSGMSSDKVRHFLNSIITPESRYLEIGCWRGSTFVSALYQNEPEIAFAIDNWSEFTEPSFNIYCFECVTGAPRDVFIWNVNRFLNCNIVVLEADCFKIDPLRNGIENINTYFFDGGHDYTSQKLALLHYYESLADCFIFIVDDWNMEEAQTGTRDSIKELNLKVLYEYEGTALHNGDMENWWDGFYISVLQK